MKEVLNHVKEVVIQASNDILKNSSGAKADIKGQGDWITKNDLLMERYIKAALKKAFPQDAFIGEEENHQVLGNIRTWVLDPIDGTINYALGLPQYGVQLALLENKKPVFSLIYLPALNRLYHTQGGKAYLNGAKISLNTEKKLSDGIITFGDFSKSNPSSRPYQIKLMEALMPHALKIRIHGASSYDFAMVASGESLAHILFSKRIWELAPGQFLAESAGAKSYLIDGSKNNFEGFGLIIAGNEGIIREIAERMETIPKGVC